MDSVSSGPIPGVRLAPLKEIPGPGGSVLHFVRGLETIESFGEVYFSEVNSGAVKAWKLHERQIQNFCVPVGMIQIVLYDDRPDSPVRGQFMEMVLGRPDAYRRLTIPRGIWYGFKGISSGPSLICNVTDIPHDPGESKKIDPDSSTIPYSW